MGKTVEPTPKPLWATAESRIILSCYVADASGWAPEVGAMVDLEVRDDEFCFHRRGRHDTNPLATILFSAIDTVDVQGYQQTKNAGIIGGGFGAKGALEGMATAAVINALTTRSKRWVVLAILSSTGHVVLRVDDALQDDVRRLMRPAQDAALAARNQPRMALDGPTSESADLVSSLERLAHLHKDGLLNDDEFARAKQRIIDSSVD